MFERYRWVICLLGTLFSTPAVLAGDLGREGGWRLYSDLNGCWMTQAAAGSKKAHSGGAVYLNVTLWRKTQKLEVSLVAGRGFPKTHSHKLLVDGTAVPLTFYGRQTAFPKDDAQTLAQLRHAGRVLYVVDTTGYVIAMERFEQALSRVVSACQA